MSYQFTAPGEARSWEKIRTLAKECVKASQGERPEVRRLKNIYEELREAKGLSRAGMDALIYQRIYGKEPERTSSTLKIRYWRTGHHVPVNRDTALAFARALVMGQEILLLDEPLSNLDAKLRVEVRTELRQIQQKFGITTMYVTHDQDEALSMSDIIAVMRRGRIEQIGSPWEIYFRPATRFVADFVGTVNFLEGTAREADGSLSVDHRGMRLRVDEDTDLQGGEPVTLVVRPEGISLMGLEETVPEGTALRGTIENYSFLGRMIRYWVRVGEEVFVIDDANVDLTGARTGDVQLRLDTRKLHVLKGGGADAAG